jgi:hypothetical protein
VSPRRDETRERRTGARASKAGPRPQTARPPLRSSVERSRRAARRRLLSGAPAFAAALAVVGFLALSGGGYDLVPRQELALVVLGALAAAAALGWLPRGRLDGALAVPVVAGCGLALWTALSFSWTDSEERTLAELARLLGYLGLAGLALAALTRETFRAAAAGLSVAAVAVAALALAGRLFPDLVPAGTDVARSLRVDRLSYPLDYWNAVGAWGAMTIAIVLAWSAGSGSLAVRAAALAAFPVAGLCVYLSYSRGAVLATVVAVLVVLWLSRQRWTALAHALLGSFAVLVVVLAVRGQTPIADGTGGEGAGWVIGALVVAWLFCACAVLFTDAIGSDRLELPARLRFRVRRLALLAAAALLTAVSVAAFRGWDEFRSGAETASGGDPAARLASAGGKRSDLWGSALAAFAEHPLRGTGPGTFEFWWSREGDDPEFARDAHSLYLEHLAELGLPGFVLVVALLAGLLFAAVRARRRLRRPDGFAASTAMIAAFAAFLVAAGVDWQWEVAAVGALALTGIAVAGAAGSEPVGSGPGGTSGGRAMRAGLVAAASLAAAVQVPGLVSAELLDESRQAMREGELAGAERLAVEATEAQPWSATAHEQLALAREAAGDLDGAEEAIREAIGEEPANWRFPLVLARIQAKAGDRSAARRTFEEGRALRPLSGYYTPFSPFGFYVYTREELDEILERAISGS